MDKKVLDEFRKILLPDETVEEEFEVVDATGTRVFTVRNTFPVTTTTGNTVHYSWDSSTTTYPRGGITYTANDDGTITTTYA